jgi:hypothetical protein
MKIALILMVFLLGLSASAAVTEGQAESVQQEMLPVMMDLDGVNAVGITLCDIGTNVIDLKAESRSQVEPCIDVQFETDSKRTAAGNIFRLPLQVNGVHFAFSTGGVIQPQ